MIWALICLDIAGPLIATASSNKFIMFAVDYFTKFCIAKATPDFTVLSTAKFVFEEVIYKMGTHKLKISDKIVPYYTNYF